MDFFIVIVLLLFPFSLFSFFFNPGHPLQGAKINLKKRGQCSRSQFPSSLPKRHFCEHPCGAEDAACVISTEPMQLHSSQELH